MPAPMKNDRAHQLRMLRVCYAADAIRQSLVESVKLFPEVDIGNSCVNPAMAVAAYAELLLKQNNLMLSLIEGEEGIDYLAEAEQ